MFDDITKLGGRIISKKFIGFDTETVGDLNLFRLGSFIFDEYNKTFYSKREMIDFIFNNKRLFQGKLIVATSLQFDIIALFFGEKEFADLQILWNKSRIISIKINMKDKAKHGDIIFIDTLNYNLASVEELGKLIGIPKLTIDKNLFKKEILTKEETKILKEYNINDALISKKYMEFFQKTLNKLGGNCKLTISSCSFDLFRRKYLKISLMKEEKVLQDNTITDWIFLCYHGGRTEAFNKGTYDDVFYYDVNSLYPSVMIENYYPVPQSILIPEKLSIENIINYFGVSECLVEAPDINIPVLPVKTTKLLFPIGIFRGVWTNELLKYALSLGYKIIEIYKQIIYTKKIKLFYNYVKDLYGLRLSLKLLNSTEEQTIKLFLNTLYGKFGQKKNINYNIIPISEMTDKKLSKFIDAGYEINESGDKLFFIIGKENEKYPKNTFPIIASYVTSYAQIYMHKLYLKYPPLYTDTDSIITSYKIDDNNLLGNGLGKLKCEKFGTIEIYGPKCYAFNKIPTVKGIYFNKEMKPTEKYELFKNYISNMPIEQNNFIKLKASLRRIGGILPNQKITTMKQLSNNIEEKRIFNINGQSMPIKLKNENK